MLTGSSALKFEGTKQITTPKIKAVMSDNYYSIGENSSLGMTQESQHLLHGTVFNDKIIICAEVGGVQTYTLDGTSLINTQAGIFDSSNIIGSTLVLTRTNFPSFIKRDYTGDGVNWSGGITILGGVTDTEAGYSAGQSTIYYLLNTGTTTYEGFDAKSGYGLYAARDIGSGFGSSVILGRQEFVGKSTAHVYLPVGMLGIKAENNMDRLIMKTSNNFSGDGIKVVDTDGYNVYREENILTSDTTGIDRLIRLYGMVESNSTFYLAYRTFDKYYDATTGTSIPQQSNSNLMVMSSKDALNWSVSVDTRIAPNECVIIPGQSLTNPCEYAIIGYSQGTGYDNLYVYKKSGELDISENIMSYQNQNNERITLTIGNYK